MATTNFADVATTIRTLFNATWVTAEPDYPVYVQNDLPTRKGADERYVVLDILPADSRLVALPKLGRDWGLVSVQIFVPLAEGDGTLREKADEVRDIFKISTSDNVRFGMPRIGFIGQNGSRFQANVTVDYWADFTAN